MPQLPLHSPLFLGLFLTSGHGPWTERAHRTGVVLEHARAMQNALRSARVLYLYDADRSVRKGRSLSVSSIHSLGLIYGTRYQLRLCT